MMKKEEEKRKKKKFPVYTPQLKKKMRHTSVTKAARSSGVASGFLSWEATLVAATKKRANPDAFDLKGGSKEMEKKKKKSKKKKKEKGRRK